jgi:hypothetical protein
MKLVFESDHLEPYDRLVMLVLAEHAGDDLTCYPSVSRICARTGMGERGVQGVLKRLQERGQITISANGGKKGANLYRLNMAFTPAPDAPPTPAPDAPAPDAPPHPIPFTPAPDAPLPPHRAHPNRHLTIIEPSEKKGRAEKPETILGEVASPAAVASFCAYRKRHKGGALTLTAANRLLANLKTIMDGGGDPDDALGMAEERGWQTVKPDWYFKEAKNGNGTGLSRTSEGRQNRADPALEQIARLAGLGQASGYGGG